MKRLFSTLIIIGFLAPVFMTENAFSQRRGPDAASDELVRLARTTARAVVRNSRSLTQVERDRIKAMLHQINNIIYPGPQPSGEYYCAAACKFYNGKPDLRYSAGATGFVELQAKQNALEALKEKAKCTYGAVHVGCEQTSPYSFEQTTCSAGCTFYNGKVDDKNLALGEGSTELEATINSIKNVKSKYKCTYGIKKSVCDSSYNPTYCRAACSLYNGKPDMNYSAGASGDNPVEAKFNAIESLKGTYTCTYGVQIAECSSTNSLPDPN